MQLRSVLFAVAPLVASVLGQSQRCDPQLNICLETYFDPVYNAQYGWTFPPIGDANYPNEFIGQFTVPLAGLWAGVTLGEGMNGNLLVVAWPNGNQIVSSTRQANNYVQPTQYFGPTLTTLDATVNSTHWKWTYRCQNCTTWTINGQSGDIDPSTFAVFGWAYSTTPVTTITDPQSTMQEHDDARLWGFNATAGLVSDATYAEYLALAAHKTTIASKPPSTTTTTKPATTSAVPTTTTSTSAGPTVSAKPYDYIVVGAGNVGLVVVDRLTQAGKNVLLIERGGPATYNTGGNVIPPWLVGTDYTRFDVPGLFEEEFSDANPFYWCNDIGTFAGCLIGGGASINGMLYWYPPDIDFATSNGWPTGWQTPDSAYAALAARLPSTDTPSPDGKQYLTQVYDLVSQLLAKRNFQAIDINTNPNSKDYVYGRPNFNFVKGERNGPMGTYFQTAKVRPNFTLWQYTYVTGLVRNGAQITGVRTNYTAYGGNGVVPLTAKGRVILSAGCFGTARILFQSGIGPVDQLQLVQSNSQFGPLLPPQAQWINLPVGYNTSDNPSIDLVFTHPSIDSYDNWAPIWANPRPADAAQYRANGTGVFAGPSPKLNYWEALSGPDGKTRYVQGTARPGAAFVTTSFPYNASQIFTITVYISTGLTSRGRIGVDSTMYGKIITDPWFQDPNDKATIITAINNLLSTANQIPNLNMITPDNTTTITDYVNNYSMGAIGSNHWTGSTRIGTTPLYSVVDSNTKVWNTTNLFIVDAGIVPGQPMGNPHAMLMVVGEIAVPKILALAGGP